MTDTITPNDAKSQGIDPHTDENQDGANPSLSTNPSSTEQVKSEEDSADGLATETIMTEKSDDNAINEITDKFESMIAEMDARYSEQIQKLSAQIANQVIAIQSEPAKPKHPGFDELVIDF